MTNPKRLTGPSVLILAGLVIRHFAPDLHGLGTFLVCFGAFALAVTA